jgi:pimeloyl-ACP methyl ester carboxylesterase
MTIASTGRSEAGISYWRLGSGPPILLLHGLPGSATSWLAVAQRLAAWHELIVPDLLGFGASAKPTSLAQLHAAGQADALAQLLDELALDRVVVVGHDFGGPVAVQLAGRLPGRLTHLGLLATNLFPDTPIPFPLSVVNWPVIGRTAERLLFSRASLRIMLRTGTGRPRVRLDPSTYLGDADQARSIRTILAGSLSSLRELYEPVERYARTISVPTFVGWGTRDPFFPVAQGERAAAALSTSLRLYPDAGHFLPEERAAEIASDLALLAQMTNQANRRATHA